MDMFETAVRDINNLVKICMAMGSEDEKNINVTHDEALDLINKMTAKLQADAISLVCAKAVIAGDKKKAKLYTDMYEKQIKNVLEK